MSDYLDKPLRTLAEYEAEQDALHVFGSLKLVTYDLRAPGVGGHDGLEVSEYADCLKGVASLMEDVTRFRKVWEDGQGYYIHANGRQIACHEKG